MFVEALPAFRLCYATGWQDPELHARELGSSGEQSAQVQNAWSTKSADLLLMNTLGYQYS